MEGFLGVGPIRKAADKNMAGVFVGYHLWKQHKAH